MNNFTIVLLTVVLISTIVYFVIQVLEEYSIRLHSDGNLPKSKNYEDAITEYLQNCNFLTDDSICDVKSEVGINYITSAFSGITFKWIIRGINYRYIIPKNSTVHKMIEEKFKELKSNRSQNLF